MRLREVRRAIKRVALWRRKSWLGSTSLGVAMVCALWLGIVTKHTENRAIDLAGAKRDLQNVTLLFEENVLRSIGEMDKALLYLRRSIEAGKGNHDFHSIVSTTDILSTLIVQVAIIDANGIMRASNVGPQPAPATDLSDREHYRFHIGRTTDDLFISKPVIGRASGKWSVQLTRRFLMPDGTFGGVVVASFNPAHFESFYGRIDLGKGASYALLGADGIVRASGGDPDERFRLGQDLSATSLFPILKKDKLEPFWESGAESATSQLFGLRKVAGHPVVVSASLPERTVYGDSEHNAYIMLVAGLLLTLLILWATRRAWLSEMQVKEKAEQLQLTLDHMSQGIMMVTRDLQIPILNRKSLDLLDLPRSFLHSPPRFDELVALQEQRGEFTNADLPEKMGALEAFGPSDVIGRFEMYERVRPDGTVIEVRSSRLRNGGFVRTFSDITQRRRAQVQADRMASEDTLTGLANRRTLMQHLDMVLQERMSQDASEPHPFAVLYLDLDRFKFVNDTQGHAVGDKLLLAVAERLKASLRQNDFIARLGGDEFAIVLSSSEPAERPEIVAQRLVDAIGRSYDIDSHQLLIGASIGIAIGPDNGQTGNELLIAADLALYAAKAAGRATYRFFSNEMNEGLKVRQQIETDLREAIVNEKLELHYQPIIHLQNNAIVGFEALARWRHPVNGMVPPDKFIPIAEECGLIQVLGQWVLQEACRQAAKWPKHLTVAVNLSPVQFANPGLAGMIERILAETGLEPARLEVEITEGLLMKNSDSNLATLQRLKDLGVRIAMDDFGTGYSSLGYLQSFPFDRIKVDRSFVSKLGSNASSSAIVRAVVDIAGSRGMHTTAEGVETEAQRQGLAMLGCDEAQGYLFSKPVPLDGVTKLIAEWAPQLKSAA